jgi:uncharacterized protein
MLQRWQDTAFLHWKADSRTLQETLPERLSVDTFGGDAYVGIVPFYVKDLHRPPLPSLPWISEFPETNLRTYVIGPDGERGVWFFSLDAARLAAVVGARMVYGLPYYWSSMIMVRSHDVFEYASRRIRDSSTLTNIAIRPQERIAKPSQLENFLTARFRLYTLVRGKLGAVQVEHPPWPLYKAELVHLEETLRRAASLPDRGVPLVHYSPGVTAKFSKLEILGKAK